MLVKCGLTLASSAIKGPPSCHEATAAALSMACTARVGCRRIPPCLDRHGCRRYIPAWFRPAAATLHFCDHPFRFAGRCNLDWLRGSLTLWLWPACRHLPPPSCGVRLHFAAIACNHQAMYEGRDEPRFVSMRFVADPRSASRVISSCLLRSRCNVTGGFGRSSSLPPWAASGPHAVRALSTPARCGVLRLI